MYSLSSYIIETVRYKLSMATVEKFLHKRLYPIVAFEEYVFSKRKLIELVPRSWIGIDEDN